MEESDVVLKAPPAPPGLCPGPEPSFSVVIPAYQVAQTIGERAPGGSS